MKLTPLRHVRGFDVARPVSIGVMVGIMLPLVILPLLSIFVVGTRNGPRSFWAALVALSALAFGPPPAQAAVTEAWVKRYSSPANCVRVGGYDTSGVAYGVAVSGNYAYMADDYGGLQVIDVSDPANCVRAGGIRTYGSGNSVLTRRVAISGKYAYVVNLIGLEVIDVSNPANPQRVGGYDTSGTAYGVMPPVQGLDIFSMADPGRRSGQRPGNSHSNFPRALKRARYTTPPKR